MYTENKKSKIVFLDIDGTIRDFDGTIPKSTVSAVQKARENGHSVCICSGRRRDDIDREVFAIGFDGVIANSGGYVEWKGTCVRDRHFLPEEYQTLMSGLLEYPSMFLVSTKEKNYLLDEGSLPFCARVRSIFTDLEIRIDILKPSEERERILAFPDVDKIIVFSDALLGNVAKSKWGESFCVVDSSIPHGAAWSGEFTSSVVNKGEGIRALLSAGGYDREDTIAIGDSENDVDMLKFAQTGIAMGNATEAAKRAADDITDDVKNGGIQKAFLKMGLLG